MKEVINNEKWLMEVRRKMEDYSVSPPTDGWDKVEKKLVTSPQKGRIFPLRYRLLVSAAVIATLIGVFTVLHYFYASSPAIMTRRPIAARMAPSNSRSEKVYSNSVGTPVTNTLLAQSSVTGNANNSSARYTTVASASSSTPVETEQNNLPPQQTSQSQQTQQQPQQQSQPQQNSQPQQTAEQNNQQATHHVYKRNHSSEATSEKRHSHGGWSMSMGLGGSTGSSELSGGNDMSETSSSKPYDWLSTSLMNADDNNSHERSVKLKHYQPIHVGLILSKHISNRFSIQTGLTGSYLHSVPRNKFLESAFNQRIYYVGIPLNVSYLLYKHKNFSVYWSNGTEVEKCVYAKQGDTRLKMRKLQWSVNSAIGAQYHLAKNLAAFVEPGVSYYWGNGTNIETYRTQNPFSVDIHFGLKLDY